MTIWVVARNGKVIGARATEESAEELVDKDMAGQKDECLYETTLTELIN